MKQILKEMTHCADTDYPVTWMRQTLSQAYDGKSHFQKGNQMYDFKGDGSLTCPNCDSPMNCREGRIEFWELLTRFYLWRLPTYLAKVDRDLEKKYHAKFGDSVSVTPAQMIGLWRLLNQPYIVSFHEKCAGGFVRSTKGNPNQYTNGTAWFACDGTGKVCAKCHQNHLEEAQVRIRKEHPTLSCCCGRTAAKCKCPDFSKPNSKFIIDCEYCRGKGIVEIVYGRYTEKEYLEDRPSAYARYFRENKRWSTRRYDDENDDVWFSGWASQRTDIEKKFHVSVPILKKILEAYLVKIKGSNFCAINDNLDDFKRGGN